MLFYLCYSGYIFNYNQTAKAVALRGLLFPQDISSVNAAKGSSNQISLVLIKLKIQKLGWKPLSLELE